MHVALLYMFSLASLVAGRSNVPHRRSIDVCAYINMDVNLGLVSTSVGICACLGRLESAISSNSLIRATATTLNGLADAKAKIALAINNAPGKQSCTYPDYAIPTCSSTDPCGYTCPMDRVKSNGQCKCGTDSYDCNGTCTPNTQACSSQRPTSLHKKSNYGRSENGPEVNDWALRSLSGSHCRTGAKMCGVFGKPDEWECVQVNDDLESCGGCVVPLLRDETPGVDCSDLPGVNSVACVQGACRVYKCLPGWALSSDKRSCKRSPIVQRGINQPRASNNDSSGAPDDSSAVRPQDW